MHALVTNDDGIDSHFLKLLVDALTPQFTVSVAAPATEQSWISRAFSRRTPVSIEADDRLGVPAWRIGGTPSDCVNIALGHLLEAPPDLVISGPNLGFNATLPLILTSGTVAGALEGAMWGLRALAVSQQLPLGRFDEIAGGRGRAADFEATIACSARRAADFAAQLVHQPKPETSIVHNLNFPPAYAPDAPIERTRPANIHLRRLFEPHEGAFRFCYPPDREVTFNPEDSDLRCLGRGHISHSVLDYSALGG